ncbi:hypothetical protein PIIN_05670 [Serendipita indica DSM 11827]|uniref:DJ-1/PfpI domain-containing protein n=1 Tax=Serendipita indica (strain DSM 11827) TaxID=1109443 RepID=G4TK89_SERID|nr:hypothetical protein PIIN_05670 [Serendipita indica DSM 11827]
MANQSQALTPPMQLLSTLLLLLATCTAVVVAGGRPPPPAPPPPKPIPLRWGVLAFPKYVGLDAYGPIEMLNIVKFLTPNMTIAVIAETMDPVPAHVVNDLGGPATLMQPTHTIYDNVTLDVLLIPGGPGSRIAYNNTNIINYVKNVYPKLQYIVSVCTGAQVLAKAGILDGKRATTNKFSWAEMVRSGPNVKWQPCARWVTDGNIWTSSGVAAGIDLTHAFIKKIFRNETLADRAANILEIEIHKDPSWDPFCKVWNATI